MFKEDILKTKINNLLVTLHEVTKAEAKYVKLKDSILLELIELRKELALEQIENGTVVYISPTPPFSVSDQQVFDFFPALQSNVEPERLTSSA